VKKQQDFSQTSDMHHRKFQTACMQQQDMVQEDKNTQDFDLNRTRDNVNHLNCV